MTALEFSYSLNKISRSLKPYALKLTEDLEDAKDLLQETVLKAYINRDKFADGTNLKAWLYTIMKNTFITNYHRTVRRTNFIDTTNNLHYINSTKNIENMAYSTFALGDVYNALKKIDNSYRVPFMMYFNGYKYREIADELKIPIGTVKIRIHIARKELKNLLKNYSFRN